MKIVTNSQQLTVKKSLVLLGTATLSILAIVKFKKLLKNLLNLVLNNSNVPFQPINQSKKILYQCCGVWKNPRHNSFDPNERIIISNPGELKQKLQKMKKDGIQELQVLTDYDQTITAFGSKEKPQPATFGQLRESKHASDEFKSLLRGLFLKYHPYEKDSTISKEQKVIYMEEWNRGIEDAFKKENMLKSNILKSLEESTLSFRYHYQEYLRCLANINLPYYVVSGGISSILKTMLDTIIDTNNDYSNFFIFSNQAIFDENNIVSKMNMAVNTCNKDEKVNHREFILSKNTLLFGDYHHDVFMKNQLNSECVISILFLRDSMQNDIENLQKDWDIIIRGDGSYILHHIITSYIAGNDICDLQLIGKAQTEFTNNIIYNEIKQLLL